VCLWVETSVGLADCLYDVLMEAIAEESSAAAETKSASACLNYEVLNSKLQRCQVNSEVTARILILIMRVAQAVFRPVAPIFVVDKEIEAVSRKRPGLGAGQTSEIASG
jgi:hypothetical protein